MWEEKEHKGDKPKQSFQELQERICSLEKKLQQLSSTAHTSVNEERYMDVGTACRFLGTGRTSLYELMKSGKLAYTYIGKQRRVLISDVKKYVQRNYVPTKGSIL
jgi:excisionase family DNA binding protein